MKISKSTGTLLVAVGCLLAGVDIFFWWAASRAVECRLIASYNYQHVILALIISLGLVFAGALVVWKGNEHDQP